jgi:hypothetical protein
MARVCRRTVGSYSINCSKPGPPACGYRKQPAIGRQVARAEAIVRGSPNFISLRNICVNRLIQAPVAAIMSCITHNLGDSRGQVRKTAKFAAPLL